MALTWQREVDTLGRGAVGATNSTTSRGMQPRVLGRRVEVEYSGAVG